MIKAAGRGAGGRRLLVFGLSRENTRLLLDGKPILVDAERDMGVAGGPEILILGGETEEEIAEELRKWMANAPGGAGPAGG